MDGLSLRGNTYTLFMFKNVALIVLYDDQRRFLLQDRKHISRYGEPWALFGGEIEEGEKPEQTLVRELKEEIWYVPDEINHLIDVTDRVNADWVLTAHVYYAKCPPLHELHQMEGRNMKMFSIEEARKLKFDGPLPYRIIDAIESQLTKMELVERQDGVGHTPVVKPKGWDVDDVTHKPA